MMKIIDNLKIQAAAHRTLAICAIFLVILALICGAYFGWDMYKYRKTSAFAFDKLKKELTPPDPKALAQLVDFNSLSLDLADAIRQSFPFFMAGNDQERRIQHLIQMAVLKKFMEKEEPKAPKDESEEESLKKDLEIFPADFVSQLASTMQLRNVSQDEALISAKINNPLLKQTFTLVFSMRKTQDGWKVRHIANSKELAAQMRVAMLDRYSRQRAVYVDKNTITTRRMNDILPIQSCTADAGLLSDAKITLMVVHVIARNKGNHQINNFNLDTVIMGKNGKPILRRYLNVAKPVAPGEDFNHRWNFELDSNSPLAKALIAGGPLTCDGAWQTLGMGSGEVLHIIEVPEGASPCDIDGHNHPAGFCMTPLFRQ